MRSWLKYGSTAALIIFACTAVRAQSPGMWLNMGYDVNMPASMSFKNYITNPAYRGFNLGLAYPFNSQLSLGVNVAHNDYYQKYPRQTYSSTGSSISAVVSNSIQQTPLTLSLQYVVLKHGFFRPYIGAGGGVNFIGFDQYLGEFDNPQTTAKWTANGEAGLLLVLSNYSGTAIRLGAQYNYAPLNNYGVNDLDNWGFQAGVRFGLH